MKKIKPKFICKMCGLHANKPVQCASKKCLTYVTVNHVGGVA